MPSIFYALFRINCFPLKYRRDGCNIIPGMPHDLERTHVYGRFDGGKVLLFLGRGGQHFFRLLHVNLCSGCLGFSTKRVYLSQ